MGQEDRSHSEIPIDIRKVNCEKSGQMKMGMVVCCAKKGRRYYGRDFGMFMFIMNEPFTQFL